MKNRLLILPGIILLVSAILTAYSGFMYPGPNNAILHYILVTLTTIGLGLTGISLCFLRNKPRFRAFVVSGTEAAALAALISLGNLVFELIKTKNVSFGEDSYLFTQRINIILTALAYTSLVFNQFFKNKPVMIITICFFGAAAMNTLSLAGDWLDSILGGFLLHNKVSRVVLFLLLGYLAEVLAAAGAILFTIFARKPLRPATEPQQPLFTELYESGDEASAEESEEILSLPAADEDEIAEDACDDEEISIVVSEELTPESDEPAAAPAEQPEEIPAEESAEPQAAAPAAATFDEIKRSLMNLRELHESGLITDNEYEQRRQKILEKL